MRPNLQDPNDRICTECETAGDLICCDGPCLRAFHLECIGVLLDQLDDDQPWFCSDCERKMHRCFACKNYDYDKVMIKCANDSCGKFYHKACIPGLKAANVEGWSCDRHICKSCSEPGEEDDGEAWHCFRCPASYHRKCRPKDIHILDDGVFLCIQHVRDSKGLPPLPAKMMANAGLDPRARPETGRSKHVATYSASMRFSLFKSKRAVKSEPMATRASAPRKGSKQLSSVKTGKIKSESTEDVQDSIKPEPLPVQLTTPDDYMIPKGEKPIIVENTEDIIESDMTVDADNGGDMKKRKEREEDVEEEKMEGVQYKELLEQSFFKIRRRRGGRGQRLRREMAMHHEQYQAGFRSDTYGSTPVAISVLSSMHHIPLPQQPYKVPPPLSMAAPAPAQIGLGLSRTILAQPQPERPPSATELVKKRHIEELLAQERLIQEGRAEALLQERLRQEQLSQERLMQERRAQDLLQQRFRQEQQLQQEKIMQERRAQELLIERMRQEKQLQEKQMQERRVKELLQERLRQQRLAAAAQQRMAQEASLQERRRLSQAQASQVSRSAFGLGIAQSEQQTGSPAPASPLMKSGNPFGINPSGLVLGGSAQMAQSSWGLSDLIPGSLQSALPNQQQRILHSGDDTTTPMSSKKEDPFALIGLLEKYGVLPTL